MRINVPKIQHCILLICYAFSAVQQKLCQSQSRMVNSEQHVNSVCVWTVNSEQRVDSEQCVDSEHAVCGQ